MLIKRSIVERWYQTDSWVYKNFAYLFSNPLWNKKVPRGFSVCPYFWLNLFSMFIFRPLFVWPIQYFVRPVLRLIGKPAEVVDDFLFDFLTRIKLMNCSRSHGIGCLAGIAYSLIAFVAVFATIKTGQWTVNDFYPYVSNTRFGMFAFWSLASFVGLWGIIATHKAITKTECKTMVYLYVWLGLFLVIAPFVIPGDIAFGCGKLMAGIAAVAVTIAGAFWYVGCFLAKWIWFGLVWSPMLGIPWWGFLIAVTIGGYIADKIGERIDMGKMELYRQQTTQEYWERNRSSWLSFFLRVLTEGDFYKDGQLFAGSGRNVDFDEGIFSDSIKNESCYYLRITIYRKALELMLADKLTALQTSYPFVNMEKWKEFAELGTELRFLQINDLLLNGNVPDLAFSNDGFRRHVLQAVDSPQIKPLIDADIAAHSNRIAEKNAKRAAAQVSWASVTCKRVTTMLSYGAANVGRSIKWVAMQVGAFFMYLWILIKAKKQGACPYITFTEPTKKK